MRVEDLLFALVVSTPVRVLHTTSECVKGVTVVIYQCIPSTDSIVLPIWKFDTIFNMDWMTCPSTFIEYQKKKVQLTLKANVRITF